MVSVFPRYSPSHDITAGDGRLKRLRCRFSCACCNGGQAPFSVMGGFPLWSPPVSRIRPVGGGKTSGYSIWLGRRRVLYWLPWY